jgi:hypothetical protein
MHQYTSKRSLRKTWQGSGIMEFNSMDFLTNDEITVLNRADFDSLRL